MLEFYREGCDEGIDPSFHEPQLRDELERHVRYLAEDVGERNFENSHGLAQTIQYISDYWSRSSYSVQSQTYQAYGMEFTNLWVELPGRSRADEIVVLGAHYDTIVGTPGADDNATAVAGLLALSGRALERDWERTMRFVAFANEEPPFFMSSTMGSLVYAQSCQKRSDRIKAMVCLEMLGYYSEDQGDTLGVLPSRGNFIGLVGDPASEDVLKKAAQGFRRAVKFPFQAAAPSSIDVPYAAFSDHWSFWQCGYPAFMVTDTGPLRNPHYHLPSDLPDTLDFEQMTRVVVGVEGALDELANRS